MGARCVVTRVSHELGWADLRVFPTNGARPWSKRVPLGLLPGSGWVDREGLFGVGGPGVARHRHRPRSDAWYRLRGSGLGGSDVAAAMGVSPWVSPFTLWHRKTGAVPLQPDNQSMSWGRRVEPLLLEEFHANRPGVVRVPCEGVTFVRDGWMVANPDGVLWTRDTGLTVWEGKTTDASTVWEWADGPPPYYRVQVLWYLHVLGVQRAVVSVLVGGNRYEEHEVVADPEEIGVVVDTCHRFWRTVLDGTPPPLDGSLSTYQSLRELHPNIDDTSLPVPPQIGETYLSCDQERRRADEEFRVARAELLEAMGTARYATVDGVTVARRQPARGGTVALYPIHPDQPKETT